MSTAIPHTPRCIVIAGPNGAGKTTFAREFLPRGAGVGHFVNADLIAAGLSPFRPTLVALADAWAVYDNSRLRLHCWRRNDEGSEETARSVVRGGRRSSVAPSWRHGPEDCAHARNASLRLERRQDRRRETLRRGTDDDETIGGIRAPPGRPAGREGT